MSEDRRKERALATEIEDIIESKVKVFRLELAKSMEKQVKSRETMYDIASDLGSSLISNFGPPITKTVKDKVRDINSQRAQKKAQEEAAAAEAEKARQAAETRGEVPAGYEHPIPRTPEGDVVE